MEVRTACILAGSAATIFVLLAAPHSVANRLARTSPVHICTAIKISKCFSRPVIKRANEMKTVKTVAGDETAKHVIFNCNDISYVWFTKHHIHT
jgi:hypothetical protein